MLLSSKSVLFECIKAVTQVRSNDVVIMRINPLMPTVAIIGTAIKHPVPDRVKLSFVFLTSGHSDAKMHFDAQG